MTFDRLLYIDRLKQAGIAEHLARAHAEALREALLETVATKADLQELAASIDRRFDAVDRRFEAVDRSFEAVDRRFEAVDRRFEAVNDKFGSLESRLEHKIELTARDLIIKGAGGLVVLAGLMIGLKLFG